MIFTSGRGVLEAITPFVSITEGGRTTAARSLLNGDLHSGDVRFLVYGYVGGDGAVLTRAKVKELRDMLADILGDDPPAVAKARTGYEAGLETAAVLCETYQRTVDPSELAERIRRLK